MFCPECGSKNDDNAVFCCNCGISLQSTEAAKPASPSAEKAGLSSNDKILLAELCIALLSIILFIFMYNMYYSAKSTAEKYVEAVFEGDWNALYDTLYIEDSDDFTTKEAFVTAQNLNATAAKQYISILDVKKLSGGFSDKAYRVSYRLEDQPDSITIELKRKGLTWKVSENPYLSKNYMITVPAGASVSLDTIAVSGSLTPSEKIEGFDTYVIPQVFGSTHFVELSGGELKDSSQLFSYYGSDDSGSDLQSSIIAVQYNEETIESVMKQGEADLKEILESAAANKKFSDVKAFENAFDAYKEDIINTYEYLRDDTFGCGNSNYSLTKYQLSNGEMNGRVTSGEDNSTLIEVVIKGNYSYESASILWSGSTYTNDGDGTCSHTLYYIKDGDAWKLYRMDLDTYGIY